MMQNKHHQVHQHSTDRDARQSGVDEDALGIPQEVTGVRKLKPSCIDPGTVNTG